MGPPGSDVCSRNRDIMLATWQDWGFRQHQLSVQDQQLVVFLGFEIHTELLVVRLPRVKLDQTHQLVREWLGKRREIWRAY